jgi:UDP-N-acetylmuramoyl-L-alanyl-D-glutamate--2,6-diaminopimelate ligase
VVTRLSELVAGLGVSGSPALDPERGSGSDPEVSGIAHDSRRTAAGDLFVAWRGERFDGADYAADAVAAGAVAVLAASPPAGNPPTGAAGRPSGGPVPWLTADDPHALLAPLALRLYHAPHRELLIAGVTGTNGKSTVAELLASILRASGRHAAYLGTLGYRFGDLAFDPGRTTPEASDLHRMLRRMRDAGAEAAAMEVSSHALALGRVAGLELDVAVFTNLTRDHYDFHRDAEGYYAAKRRLFTMLKAGGGAAVNLGDPWGARLAGELAAERIEAVTFGAGGAVEARSVELDLAGTRGTFATPRGELELASPLLGRFNLENLLAAVAAAEALGLPHPAVAAGVASRGPLPGRMQPVTLAGGRRLPVPVFVDYAHTDAALAAAIASLRELSGRRIAVVFGCGGDRDPGKRPLMGRVAGELADLPVATSDNPRTEDPLAILAAVEEGLKASGHPSYRVVPDRRQAIRRAIAVAAQRCEPAAGESWAVLIAGKGDEPVQIVDDRELPFHDYDEAASALEEIHGQTVGG